MQKFQVHTIETAPEQSRPLLSRVAARFGFVPGLLAGLAESPAALEGYLGLAAQFERSSLSPAEQQVVALAVSVENDCEFCVGAHSYIARKMVGLDAREIDALRAGAPLHDPRLAALASFTRLVVRERGWVDAEAVSAFHAAGFTRAQLLEVVLGVAQKVLSNYANHLMGTEPDAAFATERWRRGPRPEWRRQ